MNALRAVLVFIGVVALLALVHTLVDRPSEPCFNNDETRHVMTGVFFRDAFVDQPWDHPRDYAVRYYQQYPALGLLVWPPLFYVLEGLAMLAAGTSIVTAKALIACFAVLAAGYLFRMVLWTHDLFTATVTVLLFGFSPLGFDFSRQVMLEMPAVAWCLMALYYGARYVEEERRRDLVFATIGFILAALTRFDVLFLVPVFLILLIARRRLTLLRRKSVLAALLIAVVCLAPVYALTALEFGSVHVRSIRGGSTAETSTFLAPLNLYYYPARVNQQIGWFAIAPLLLGLFTGLWTMPHASFWPYAAVVGGVYVTFSPLGELESRHVIYWVPALALFAAAGLHLLAAWLRLAPLRFVLAGIVVGGAAGLACRQPASQLRGYEPLAAYIVANTHETPVVLFDGAFNGNFIYQMRRHDEERRLTILRGDKLLANAPTEDASGSATGGAEAILATLFRFDPEFLIVEDPVSPDMPATSERLHDALATHPERFREETVFPIEGNLCWFPGKELRVYRSVLRNPVRDEDPGRGLGSMLKIGMPRRGPP